MSAEIVAPMGQPPTPLLSRLQAAGLLGVCPGTLDNERKRGKLRAHKLGSRVLFDPREITRYIDAQKEGER